MMVVGQKPLLMQKRPPFWQPEPLTRGFQHDAHLTGAHAIAIGRPGSDASEGG
jgi:hypothetical protein